MITHSIPAESNCFYFHCAEKDLNDGGSSYIDIIISPELMEPTSPVDPNLPTEPGGGGNSGK